MAKLTEDVQVFIVQQLAMFETPSKVAATVKSEFGVEVSRQQVETYDPKRAGKKPTAKWVAIHEATRKEFLEKMAGVASQHRAVRIQRLERMAIRLEEKALETKSPALAAQLLKTVAEMYEQIAKELGEKYTNNFKFGSTDPVKDLAKQLGVSPEELSQVLAGDGIGDTSTASAEAAA